MMYPPVGIRPLVHQTLLPLPQSTSIIVTQFLRVYRRLWRLVQASWSFFAGRGLVPNDRIKPPASSTASVSASQDYSRSRYDVADIDTDEPEPDGDVAYPGVSETCGPSHVTEVMNVPIMRLPSPTVPMSSSMETLPNRFLALPVGHPSPTATGPSSPRPASSITMAVGSSSSEKPFVILTPIEPHEVSRYKREFDVQTSQTRFDGALAPFQRDFEHNSIGFGWERRLHPEGAIYYVHPEKRICTDANVNESVIRDEIDVAVEDLEFSFQAQAVERTNDDEVVFELLSRDSDHHSHYGYYFVDHRRHTAFWPQEYHDAEKFSEVKVISSDAHVGQELNAWYWLHVSYFPRPILLKEIEMLQDQLLSLIVDLELSDVSLAPFSSQSMIKIMNTLEVGKKFQHAGQSPGLNHAAARLLAEFAHARFLHYHGEHGARLSAGQTVYGSATRSRTRCFTFLNMLLFGRPEDYLERLEAVSVDDVFSYSPWQQYIAREMDRWKAMTVQCALFVTGNLAFLAIPSVIASSPSMPDQQNALARNSTIDVSFEVRSVFFGSIRHSSSSTWSAAQILSAISCILFFISIVNNFVLRELYSGKEGSDFNSAIKFHVQQRKFAGKVFEGLECLAILHSFPLSWLMWGAVLSVVSFISWSYYTKHAVIGVLWAVGIALLLLSGSLWLGVKVPDYASIILPPLAPAWPWSTDDNRGEASPNTTAQWFWSWSPVSVRSARRQNTSPNDAVPVNDTVELNSLRRRESSTSPA